MAPSTARGANPGTWTTCSSEGSEGREAEQGERKRKYSGAGGAMGAVQHIGTELKEQSGFKDDGLYM